MLIYVSCETPEQITDYLYFKLRSLFLHGSIYSRQWRSSITCRPWISAILPRPHPMLNSITAGIFLWTLLAVQISKCALCMLMREECHCKKCISTGSLTFCKARHAIEALTNE